jgi:hypothetical protein
MSALLEKIGGEIPLARIAYHRNDGRLRVTVRLEHRDVNVRAGGDTSDDPLAVVRLRTSGFAGFSNCIG